MPYDQEYFPFLTENSFFFVVLLCMNSLFFFLRTTSSTTLVVMFVLTGAQQARNMLGCARVMAGLHSSGNSPRQMTWTKRCWRSRAPCVRASAASSWSRVLRSCFRGPSSWSARARQCATRAMLVKQEITCWLLLSYYSCWWWFCWTGNCNRITVIADP